jgi:hypothetical protein
MLKFYILWSKGIKFLEKVTYNIPSKEIVVVINTLNEEEKQKGVDYCIKNSLEFFVTESDGTPATGKNSVLKLFLESDNDYMVAIDGDDHLTPYGVRVYRDLAIHPTPPDMVVLYRQQELTEDNRVVYPFDKSSFTLDYAELVELFTTHVEYALPLEKAETWAKDRLEFDNYMYRKMESREFMCRMVFHSRKAAEYMNYTNRLVVGEDTHQFLRIKKLAVEGKLNVLRRKERERPTYIYTSDGKSSIMRTVYRYDWSWVRPLLDELYKLEGLPDDVSLNEFKDEEWRT